mgnify:CR=1 FL=1
MLEHKSIYADSTANVPFEYPPLEEDMNLTPPTIRLGSALGEFVMLLSLLHLVWTWIHRNDGVVRASQPIFGRKHALAAPLSWHLPAFLLVDK